MSPLTRIGLNQTLLRTVVLVLMAAVATLHAAPPGTRKFDIPAGPAIESFKKFTMQSGEQLLYSVDAVEAFTTQPLKGEFTARVALERMLAGTPLRVAADQSNGALTVTKVAAPKRPAPPHAPARP